MESRYSAWSLDLQADDATRSPQSPRPQGDFRPGPLDDASDVVLADAATLDWLTCTPRLVETLRGWGVLPA